MSERYPDDAALLALETDEATGVQYIPTGRSPYYLDFRKLVQRMLRAAERANDLRVYPSGDLSIGVRPGRCVIGGASVNFAGEDVIPLENNRTLSVWLDGAGAVQVSDAGLPADRTSHVPLADVVTEAGAIASITDRRGEAFLGVPSLASMGVATAAATIDQALLGLDTSVTAALLNALAAGPMGSADFAHRHEQMATDLDGETGFRLENQNAGDDANVALHFDLPARLPGATSLLPDPATGWLRQRIGTQSYPLVGVAPMQLARAGDLTASITGLLIGAAPCDGVIDALVLSLGRNLAGDQPADGVAATVRVNGTAAASTDPAITVADGAGIRSTARGDGTAAVIKTDGSAEVARGDVLTVDLARTANGNVSAEAADVAVLVIVRPTGPA